MTLIVLVGILLGTFLLLTAIDAARGRRWMSVRRRGQISLAFLFMFTGLGHFVESDQMMQMLPPWVPGRLVIILASGVFEWLLAMGLLLPRYASLTGLCVMVFLVLVFPGNIYAAFNRVPMGGHEAGPAYLLVRGPFQLLLIVWAWRFAARKDLDEPTEHAAPADRSPRVRSHGPA